MRELQSDNLLEEPRARLESLTAESNKDCQIRFAFIQGCSPRVVSSALVDETAQLDADGKADGDEGGEDR
ncbi:MAG: hypothetical protein QOH25_2754 [Acidobacteriota bacterium]|jgi:hypothetical protein|nr:hypothetical protein [Acidobacteriota bacterium]